MDFFLFVCYFLVACIFNTRASNLALVSFVVMLLAFLLPIEPYLLHVTYLLSAYIVAWKVKKIPLLISIVLFIIFQFIMSIDAYINLNEQTILFLLYPFIAFTIHLLIIFSLINEGLVNGHHTRSNNNFSGVSHNQSNFTHQKANTGR